MSGSATDPLVGVEQVIEIHPDAKYVVIIDTEKCDPMIVTDHLAEWWNAKDMPFILMPNYMKLVRVDQDQK